MARLRNCHRSLNKQGGATFLIMLVIMILVIATTLVSSLSTVSLKLDRNAKTAEVLAQAKEALIANAVINSTLPGRLPCPSKLGDGTAETDPSGNCTYYTGLLPWKTLGLPDLRDGDGAPLWYALSKNFHDSTNNINSDTTGDLTITGSPAANNIIAVVFAPGASIGQSRSASQNITCPTTNNSVTTENLCATQFLEGINAASSVTISPNKQFVAGNATTSFNDQLIFITADNLIPAVEKRIAREAKLCLDQYAVNSSEKYPWAAQVSDLTYTSTSGIRFGRIPTSPQITTPGPISGDSSYSNLLTKLNALQAATTVCQTNDSQQAALTSAANNLQTYLITLSNPPYTSSFTNSANAAAQAAKPGVVYSNPCDYIDNNPTNNAVQNNLNNAIATLSTLTANIPEDASMSSTWTTECTLFSASYWPLWRDMVFYSVADAYRPNGTKSCGVSCLSIKGSGNPYDGSGSYRGAVLVGGRKLNNVTRVFSDAKTYLEGANSSVTGATTLETYRLEDQSSKQINDLVICLDGKGIAATSKCY